MSPGFRKALAVLLLVLAAALAWRLALAPLWRGLATDRALIAEHRDAIARMRAIAARHDGYEAALERERGLEMLDDALLEAASDTLAAAGLQQQIKAVVEAAGGTVVSSQALESRREGPFLRVPLSVRLLVSTPELQRVLHALETARPVIVVEELLVLSRRGRSVRGRAERSDGLDVRIRIAGFLDVDRAAVTAAPPAPAGS